MNIKQSEKFSYGLGDFASNGLFLFVSSYLMYYFSDVVCLDLTVISRILIAGRIVDAVASLLMGFVVDRTRSPMGRCRPYLLFGIWPVSVLFVLLFGMPELSASLGGLYGGTLYVAFCLVYAVMNVPFSTLMSLMTADARERVQFNKYKCLGSNIGGVFVTGTTMLFVTRLAGNQRQGFLRTALLFAALFTVFMLVCFFNTKERIRPDGPENNPDIRKALSSLKKNKPWLLYCAIQFCQLTFMMIRQEATVYYAKYYLGRTELSSVLLTFTPIAAVLSAFLMPYAKRKWGARTCVLFGNGLSLLSILCTALCRRNWLGNLTFCLLSALGFSIGTGLVFVILTDTIDYGERLTGQRPQGIMTSILSFVQKMGMAVSGVVCTQILSFAGYVPDAAPSGEVLTAIQVIFLLIPGVLALAGVILAWLYPLRD